MSPAEVVPLTLAQARRYVAEHHRHNEPPRGHKFSIGLERNGELVGVVIASRPVARGADDGRTLELIRLTTEGERNACSRLYSAACRAGFAMGYRRVITYTLDTEPGSSLRASGFVIDGTTKGGEWTPAAGVWRQAEHPRLFDPPKMPTGPQDPMDEDRRMRAPAKPKPQASEEVARVIRIHDMIDEEMKARWTEPVAPEKILEVADRIAARTEG